jgi:hypothetical protein
MKKFIFTLIAMLLISAPTWATLGSVSLSPMGVATQPNDATFTMGAISGTSTADTSGVIPMQGYAGVQFKVQKVNYRGTFKIQGSHDNSTWETIFQDDTDAAGVTSTMYWQSFDGWNYERIYADPNGSNAGSCTVTGKVISPDNTKVLRYTGYWGPNVQPQELIASAALTTGTTDKYFKTKGRGVQVNINVSARSSGSLVVGLYSVSPTGDKALMVATAAITATGNYPIIVTPDLVAAANSTAVGTGNSWYILCTEGGTSDTFAATVIPIP